MSSARPLFRPLELAYRSRYAGLRERCQGAGPLLPGTQGSLALRDGTGYRYWYRRCYSLPNREMEDLVGKDGNEAALAEMRERIKFSACCQQRVRELRRLGVQVADKDVARLLVELHNKGLFASGLVLVGTQAFMAWLNEFGAVTASSRTQDVDLARRHSLKLWRAAVLPGHAGGHRDEVFPGPANARRNALGVPEAPAAAGAPPDADAV
jgi:hypothetical protein